jgi:hypothetical protein
MTRTREQHIAEQRAQARGVERVGHFGTIPREIPAWCVAGESRRIGELMAQVAHEATARDFKSYDGSGPSTALRIAAARARRHAVHCPAVDAIENANHFAAMLTAQRGREARA